MAATDFREGELATLQRLASHLRRDYRTLKRYGDYYEGLQALEHLGLAIPPELRQFVVIVNWPRVVADALEERIDLEGFRLPGQTERDEDLARVWQANNLDEESQLAHLDAIVYSRGFICIGTNEDDPQTPLVTIESPLEMTAEISARTRQVTAALRLYKDRDEVTGNHIERCTLYLPNSTIWARRGGGNGVGRGWIIEDRDDHNLGRPPVIPLVNRPRSSNRLGSSELADVIQLTDAAARALTLAQLATETLSVPQRAVLGATKGDFQDEAGNTLPAWQAYFGAIWALENSEAKVTQFNAADLSNFKTIVDHYAGLVSSTTGLPLRYFGQNTANPPSADGIRADESRLVKRAERRQRAWGGAWEEAARMIKRFQTGDWDPKLVSLESIWRNPATPTFAQQSDAAVKLVAANILPVEAAWEEMGYSQTRIAQLKKMREAELAQTDVLARQVAAYRLGVAPGGPANPVSYTDQTPNPPSKDPVKVPTPGA